MEDDLIASLTRQVKEEVLENYLTERRIVGLQIEDIETRAQETRARAVQTGKRLSRLAYLMFEPDMVTRLVEILRVPSPSFWIDCLARELSREIRIIRVRALTDKAKYRKLLLEAYRRLCRWMEEYRKAHEELAAECRAVNININKFQKNFDLLTILNFLKSLDQSVLEQKHFLGENFTAQEIVSVEQKLYLRPLSIEQFSIPIPLDLPKPEVVSTPLNRLASDVYQRNQARIKGIML